MTRKSWMLIGFALVLVITYAVFFTNRFKPETLRIHHVNRPTGYAMQTRRNAPAPPITFGLDTPGRLTELKVVPLAEWQTNQSALPVWHLVSDSNSVPVQSFVYGQTLRGMRTAVPGAQPEPLQPDVAYRLFVTAGKARGQHDFKIGGSPTEAK